MTHAPTLSIEPPPPRAAGPLQRCFGAVPPGAPAVLVPPVRLADGPAQALAELIVLLGCGEEAAALAFAGLAARDADAAAAAALQRVADEEQVHDALLGGLARGLPPPRDAPGWRRAARRFHILAGRGTAAEHLARVAAIDAAVCTVLSRVNAPQRPAGRDPVAHALLGRIHRDEARHVRLSRRLAIDRGDRRALADIAVAARHALADVLALGAAAFEALAVDPDTLLRDVRTLPPGLLRA